MKHITKEVVVSEDLARIAQDAMAVQSACNLSGVVLSFAQAMRVLNDEMRKANQGMDFVRNHPVTRLFVEQISFLGGGADYSEAYSECEKMSTPGVYLKNVLTDG